MTGHADLITLTVNGEPRQVRGGSTVREALTELGFPGVVAVERNRAIVPRASHTTARFDEGDVVEIVHLVGGG